MTDSILDTVKEDIGAMTFPDEDNPFDGPLIRDINSVLFILCQLGVGSTEAPFKITGNTETWSDFLGEDLTDLEAVRTYISKKVKAMFDPPTSQALIDVEGRITDELEWRLRLAGDKT